MAIVNGLLESSSNVDVLIQEKLHRVTETDFFKQYRVSGMNRIPLPQFESLIQSRILAAGNIAKSSTSNMNFIRFSLEKNFAIVGEDYLVLPIIESGQDASVTGYQAPKLSVDSALIFKAEKVLNHLSYEQVNQLLTDKQLDFSCAVKAIHSIDSLQAEIIRRYRHSRPQLSEAQIVELGVGIVWFNWVAYVDQNNQVQYL